MKRKTSLSIKIGKTISTIMIIAIFAIGIVLAFKTKDAKYSFYFFGVSVILTIIFALFVFLGNISKNKALVNALHNAISKPEILPMIIEALKGRPVTPSAQPVVIPPQVLPR